MILIADSGSTKCDWVLVNSNQETELETTCNGLNPAVFSEAYLLKTIKSNSDLMNYTNAITHVYFYGAGLGTETPTLLMKTVLETIFNKAEVVVKEDIYAVAYAASSNNKECIVCILGTGSNCCYFDGNDKITIKIASLGYSIMDDASGNYFGRLLLRDYYYNKMPSHIREAFEADFNLFPDDVKRKLYKEENPNAYLASFAMFLVKHKQDKYCLEMINLGFSNFIDNQITQYDRVYDLPIHFVGSIAYYLQDELKAALKSFRLNPGNFLRKPINDLVAYHIKKLN